MSSPLVRAFVALIAALVTWVCAPLAPAAAGLSDATATMSVYTYDNPLGSAPNAGSRLERGPPESYDHVTSNGTGDSWSHGVPARPHEAAARPTTTHTAALKMVRVSRAAATTSSHAEAIHDDLSPFQRTGVAANTGKALELSPASLNYPWPANNGFLGSTRVRVLKPGAQIDRYGPETGRFTSPAGTPRGMRSLRPGTTSDLSSYEVVRRLPAETGVVAPGFGETGLGIQYRLPAPVADLVRAGYLRPVG
jgi:Tuberculosis necrotizing toxin